MNQTAIGAYIALLRQRRGFTQRALAAQLGVSCHAVSKWERRTSLPDVPGLTRLALALNTSADALLGIDPARIRAEVLQAAEDCTTLLNKGNAEAAVRLLREKAARYPHEPELKVCLARALLALKTDADLREALALCRAADGQPMRLSAVYGCKQVMALALRRLGKAEQAARLLADELPAIWVSREVMLPRVAPQALANQARASNVRLLAGLLTASLERLSADRDDPAYHQAARQIQDALASIDAFL